MLKVGTIQVQFSCYLHRRDTLGDAAHNQRNRPARVARFAPNGVSEKVEDFATTPAAIVCDWRTMPIMRCLLRWQKVTIGAMETTRMKKVEQPIVTGLFINWIKTKELTAQFHLGWDVRPSPPTNQPLHL